MPSILRYLTEVRLSEYLHTYITTYSLEESIPYLVYMTLYLTEPREKFP